MKEGIFKIKKPFKESRSLGSHLHFVFTSPKYIQSLKHPPYEMVSASSPTSSQPSQSLHAPSLSVSFFSVCRTEQTAANMIPQNAKNVKFLIPETLLLIIQLGLTG